MWTVDTYNCSVLYRFCWCKFNKTTTTLKHEQLRQRLTIERKNIENYVVCELESFSHCMHSWEEGGCVVMNLHCYSTSLQIKQSSSRVAPLLSEHQSVNTCDCMPTPTIIPSTTDIFTEFTMLLLNKSPKAFLKKMQKSWINYQENGLEICWKNLWRCCIITES